MSNLDGIFYIVITNNPNVEEIPLEMITKYKGFKAAVTDLHLNSKIVIVSLARFNKESTEIVTNLDEWLLAFKNEDMETTVKKMPPTRNISKSEGLKKLYETLAV